MLRCISSISKIALQMDCMRRGFTYPTTSMEPSLSTGELCTAKVMTMKNVPMRLWTLPCPPFSTRKMKMLSRPDVLCNVLNWRLTFSTSELLYPQMKNRLRVIRARPYFFLISDNPNVTLGIVDCSLYTCCNALRNGYHNKMDTLAYTTVVFNSFQTLAKIFIIPATQNQLIQGNLFNNASVRSSTTAKNTNSAVTTSYTENPFWYQVRFWTKNNTQKRSAGFIFWCFW